MNKNIEFDFGKKLKHTLVAMLKNAATPVPPNALAAARLFEAYEWDKLPLAERRSRVADIKAELGPGSRAETFFNAYPHPFTRERYAEFRAAFDAYLHALDAEPS
jgi:hypothetical protein